MPDTKTRTERRTFTWRCWCDGELRNVVVFPPTREEKNVERGGVRGRLYEKNGDSLRTINGTVHQDSEGRVYFVPAN